MNKFKYKSKILFTVKEALSVYEIVENILLNAEQ
jgi:hypothetical protein